MEDSLLLTFIKVAVELCFCVPEYLSKFSKKDFSVRQLLILLVLKQKLKCSYEMLIDDLRTRPGVVSMLGLKRLPDPSTVRKFANRIKANIIYFMLEDATRKIKKQKHTYDESDPYSDIIQLLQTNHDDAINTMMSQKEKKR